MPTDAHPASAPPAPRAESGQPARRVADRVDVRGPRVSAGITTLVLATALVVQGPAGVVLVAVQVAAFAVAVALGVQRSPWAAVFRLVRRLADLGPPLATEDATPPRFAQACGLVVAGSGLVALVAGATLVGWVLVALVLALSTVLASTGLCIGCELYVLGLRLRGTA